MLAAPLAAATGALPALATEPVWTARYEARKADVTLALYRKRLTAPHPSHPRLPVLFLVHGSSRLGVCQAST